jgi:hypothetical protein
MVKVLFVGGVLALSACLADAAEVTIRPRFNAGVTTYDYGQNALVSVPVEAQSLAAVLPVASSKWSADSSLSLLRTGLTAFVGRTFFDFDYQYAFDGNTNSHFSSWAPVPEGTLPGLSGDHYVRFGTRADVNLERTEFAATLGYAVTDQLAIYAGYKRADSTSDFDLNGDVLGVSLIDSSVNPSITGFTAQLNQEVVYKGPFIGASYTWNINRPGMEGGLTGNMGLAFLNGVSNSGGLERLVFSGESGEFLPVPDASSLDRPPFNLAKLDGDTVGLSLALTWSGFTPIEGLMYSVGVKHYRYDFNDKNDQDFSIEMLRVDGGITYAFGL